MYSSRNTGCVKSTTAAILSGGAFIKQTCYLQREQTCPLATGGILTFTLWQQFPFHRGCIISQYENASCALSLTRPDFQLTRPRVDKGLMNLRIPFSRDVLSLCYYFFPLLNFSLLNRGKTENKIRIKEIPFLGTFIILLFVNIP